MDSPRGSVCVALSQCRRPRFDPWVRKIPWRRKWQPTPVSLPGEFHGSRSLMGLQSMGLQRVRHDLATKEQQQLSHDPNDWCYFPSGAWEIGGFHSEEDKQQRLFALLLTEVITENLVIASEYILFITKLTESQLPLNNCQWEGQTKRGT